MAAETGMAYLLVRDALHSDHKRDAAELFVSRAVRRVHSRREAICAQNQIWFDKAQTLLG
jgi:hypothetical protein